MSNNQTLQELLKQMDVPEFRKNDMNWLMRNLAVRNSDKPLFKETIKQIIKQLKGTKK